VTVLEAGAAPARRVTIQPRAASRRERWLRRLPLLPALIYIIVVTQIPFVVTLWYSFQNYYFDVPGGARFTGLSNYTTVFTNAARSQAIMRSPTVVGAWWQSARITTAGAARRLSARQDDRPSNGPSAVLQALRVLAERPAIHVCLWREIDLHPCGARDLGGPGGG